MPDSFESWRTGRHGGKVRGRVKTMQLILTGFTHDAGFRVFSFDRIGEDRVRTKCTVRADMALIRTYGIGIQDLPLLCRDLLGRVDENTAAATLTFSESDMMEYA